MMQSCHSVFESVSMVNLDVVFGKVDDTKIDLIISTIAKKDKNAAVKLAQEVLAEGWSLDIMLSQIADKVMNNDSISDPKKTMIIKTLSDTESQFTDGGSEELNLCSCFATMSTLGY